MEKTKRTGAAQSNSSESLGRNEIVRTVRNVVKHYALARGFANRIITLPITRVLDYPIPVFTKAVFFDVDFTLIYPGPMFRAEGYQAFCARHGMEVDPSTFDDAVVSAGTLLNGPEDTPYDDEIWLAYTRHIIERMGGSGPNI